MRELAEKIFVKVSEQLKGSGCTNTPEREELKEVSVKGKAIHPTNGLTCVKPIRKSRPNVSFHRYSDQLWSIVAQRSSPCGYCDQRIDVGDEITLFNGVSTWAHLAHAVDEQAAMPGNARLEVGGEAQ